MRLNEIFKSIQGEGNFVGTPSIFIRLSGCNLSCNWCDTPYTWLFSQTKINKVLNQPKLYRGDLQDLEIYDREVEEVIIKDVDWFFKNSNIFKDNAIKNVVITGGEPLLQPKALNELIEFFLNVDPVFTFEIETNGTLFPTASLVSLSLLENLQFNVSPKLENSGNSLDKRYEPEVLQEFSKINSIFKFVINNRRDMTEVQKIIEENSIPKEMIYLMPEGKTLRDQQEGSRKVISICEEYGYKYSPRLQILLWGNRRGT